MEETLISVPGTIVHLINNQHSLQLACGVFSIVRLRHGDEIVSVLARVSDNLQWPLFKHEPAVKVDDSRYFFSLPTPSDSVGDSNLLNYGVSFGSKGQEKLLEELDMVLGLYCAFSVHKVYVKSKEEVKESCGEYWTALAPNVEDYSGKAAKMIAAGSGQLIKGILWCGDVTSDRLKLGNEVLKRNVSTSDKVQINPKTLKTIRSVKKAAKMTEKVANGAPAVDEVSVNFMKSLANSKSGKKIFNMLGGEILLATLDGYSKIVDATEIAGKNVLSTSSSVTTDLVTHIYGEEAGQATDEGLTAAGHVLGTTWAGI